MRLYSRMKKVILLLLMSLFYPTAYLAKEATNNSYCRSDCKYEFSFFKKYSRKGSTFADLAVSIMYYNGTGTKVNIKKGYQHLLRAARYGEQGAQFQLGYFLMHGMYMKRDLIRSLKWLKKAEHSGFEQATDYIDLLEKKYPTHETLINLLDEQKTTSEISNIDALNNAENISNREQNPDDYILVIYNSYSYEMAFPTVRWQTCSNDCGFDYVQVQLPLIYLKSDKNI